MKIMTHNFLSPCINCFDRHVGCHGECKAYMSYAKRVRKENTDRYKYIKQKALGRRAK